MKSSVQSYIENRFKIVKLLRQTPKSEVQLAQSKETGEFVIVKKINFVGLPYKILKKNPHKLFAKILICAEDLNDTVVVEEFIQGQPLIERLQHKNFLSEDDAQKILLQLCDGLKFLHALGIIHRDIKPSNLILQADGNVKLIDFDAARIVKENQAADTIPLGTKGYAPPEQYGYSQTDARSDIYALGITFQKLLGENYSGRLKKILSKCTQQAPEMRWQNVDELKAALLNSENISAEKNSGRLKFFVSSILILAVTFALYNFFNANQTESVTIAEIPAPQVEEPKKIEEPVEVPAQTEIPKKEFTFPEISLPPTPTSTPQVSPPAQVEIPLPQTENNLPQVEEPKKVEDKPPPPVINYQTPKPFLKENSMANADYVKVEYFLDGNRFHAWVDQFDFDLQNIPPDTFEISHEEWQTYEKISANSPAIKFSHSIIEVFVKNFSDKTLKNPQLEIIFDNDGRIETKILKEKDIAPNQTIIFKIPLNQFRIDNPHYQLDAIFDRITLKFSGEGAEIRGSNAKALFHFQHR